VPKKEGRKILGTLFDSSIFPNRAPEGHVLLRTMVGGARAASVAMLDDEKLLDTVMAEVGEIAGIRATPDFFRIFRHEQAIPQYVLGHQDRLGRLDAAVSRHRGLYITGNAFRGISVNDCIENSHKLAERILKEVA
jgi:oxygen-dependent protoporphyrinogen oxidase